MKKEHLFIPYESEELLVSFGSHGQPKLFWFKDGILRNDQQMNLLFIRNENNWYMDDDEGEGYQKFLQEYVSKYKKENVTFFGSSMGAYGALYHGLKLGVNVIASNPQITKEETIKHGEPEGQNLWASLQKVDFKSIPDVFNELGKIDSAIHMIIGQNPLDIGNFEIFLSTLPENTKLTIERFASSEHIFTLNTADSIYSRAKALNYYRKAI